MSASVLKQDPNTVIGFTTHHCHSQHSSKHTEHTNTEMDKYIFIFHRLTVVLSLEKRASPQNSHCFFFLSFLLLLLLFWCCHIK